MTEAFRSFLPTRGRSKVLKNLSPERFRTTSVYGKKDATSAAYVAELGGKVVGYVSGSINEYGFGTLSVIGVSPRIFHKGVGALLMRKMVAFWRKGKMRKVSTCVSAHNSSINHAAFASMLKSMRRSSSTTYSQTDFQFIDFIFTTPVS